MNARNKAKSTGSGAAPLRSPLRVCAVAVSPVSGAAFAAVCAAVCTAACAAASLGTAAAVGAAASLGATATPFVEPQVPPVPSIAPSVSPAGPAQTEQHTVPAPPVLKYSWFDPLIDMRALIVDGFVDPPDTAAMQRAVLEAMTRALKDPYTVYVPPDSEGLLRRQFTGSYVGIGVELDVADSRPVVVSALDDSPALEVGLLPGDVILEVDGRSTEGIDSVGLDQLLPGRPGSSVKLLLRRPDGTERTVDVVRRQIESHSVKGLAREGDGWQYMLDPAKHIGYVRITQFNEHTSEQLDAALARMRGHGLSGVVLDLRGNGGGSLDAAVRVADRFLSTGGIVSLKGRNERGQTWDATSSSEDVDVPMVVLVNQSSASASEVVAGALQDNGRAKVIGTRSYGKGSVQEVRSLPDGAGMLKMTTARYYLPSGRTVARSPNDSRWGVEPDSGFHVPMTEAQLLANVQARRTWEGMASSTDQKWNDPEWIRHKASDPQLAAALSAVQGQLESGTWPVVGDLSGDVGASNDELRTQLELRRRLVAELARTERTISALRTSGAGVDDALLASDAALIDGQVVVRDRDGREVARMRIKDPAALNRALREVGAPEPKESAPPAKPNLPSSPTESAPPEASK